jgi:hypothetical protein
MKAVVMLATGGEINRMIINSSPGRQFSRCSLARAFNALGQVWNSQSRLLPPNLQALWMGDNCHYWMADVAPKL